MSPPRPATEVRSGSLEPGRPSWARSANTRHPAGWPHKPPADRMYATAVRQTDVRQTDVRQTDVRQTDVRQTDVRQTDVRLMLDFRQTDVRQHHRLMPPGWGIIILIPRTIFIVLSS